jgi:hypothetical protein
MINADMRSYNFFTLGDTNGYGSQSLSNEPKGTLKMAINTTSQSVQDNVQYKGATYIGLTHDNVDDTYVIAFGSEKLKVLYVQPKGRFKQVFMSTYAQ